LDELFQQQAFVRISAFHAADEALKAEAYKENESLQTTADILRHFKLARAIRADVVR